MLQLILLQTFPVFLVLASIFLTACNSGSEYNTNKNLSFELVNTPQTRAAYYPNLTIFQDQLLMNWVEDENDTISQLKIASWDGGKWSDSKTIAQGVDWFVNWADFPAVGYVQNEQLAAHYLAKVGSGTYAYGIFMVQSESEGTDWKQIGSPHKDTSETEHGFMSLLPLDGQLGMVWLDGRRYAKDEKQMELRFNTLGSDGQFGEEVLLDERVCDCCQTGITATSSGAVVVYRNRTEDEIRDVYRVVLKDGKWFEPASVFDDHWKIAGCPVNGPAIDARGDQVVTAWYAKPGDTAEVKVSFSRDGGEVFGPPIRIDEGNPEGRVDILMTEEGFAWVSWMENVEQNAEVLLRAVYADGKTGPVYRVGAIAPSRSSGFPILKQYKNHLYFAWTEPSEKSQLRLMRASL